MIWLAVVGAGLATSWLYAVYIKAVAGNKPARASVSDFGLMLMGSMTTQLWAVDHNNIWVLIVFDVVSAFGTYWAVKRG